MDSERNWDWLTKNIDGFRPLEVINSLTKYPPILTYHQLGERQHLVNNMFTPAAMALKGPLYGHEKINGVNARIISTPAGFLIGSREELLFAEGDLIGNPVLGIVQAVRHIADRISRTMDGWFEPDTIAVTYLEVFGGNVTDQSKQYTGSREVGARVFDHATVHLKDVAGWDRQKISAVRESDQSFQKFMNRGHLRDFVKKHELYPAPEICQIHAEQLPWTLEQTLAFLKDHTPETLCGLDKLAGGKSEGIVLRTFDRSAIVKIRYEDYERTLKGQHGKR